MAGADRYCKGWLVIRFESFPLPQTKRKRINGVEVPASVHKVKVRNRLTNSPYFQLWLQVQAKASRAGEFPRYRFAVSRRTQLAGRSRRVGISLGARNCRLDPGEELARNRRYSGLLSSHAWTARCVKLVNIGL